VIVLGLLAVVVMLGLRSKRPRIALPVAAAAAVAVYLAVAPVLAEFSTRSGSDLVTHQLEGIARPFDEDTSTLHTHLDLIREGVAKGLRQPLGQGTGSTTPAASKFGSGGEGTESGGEGTEFDFSNMFVSLGLPGGLLFLGIVGTAMVRIARRYVYRRDPLLLGIIGLAIVTLGTWLNGAHYALTPLLWVMLGWATRPDDQPEAGGRDEPPEQLPHAHSPPRG
jgi:hypothetical protein